MAIPIRQYNIMDNIGAVGDARRAGGYEDFQDFGVGPVQPSPTYPTMGAISRIGQTPPPTDLSAPQDPNIAELMQQFYTPETGATDAFNQLVRNAPQRKAPGLARTLAASGAALKGGIETAEKYMYAPFMRDTADWMAKMDPNYKAASLENARNANERQLAGNMAQYTMAERKQTETERKNRADEKIRQQRADVYDFKSRNPNMRFDFSGPTVLAADPLTGKTYDTKVPTGSMTDMDRINLQGEWRVRAAQEAGGQARATERVRQEGREALADKRGWQVVQSADGQAWAVNPQTRSLEPIQPPTGVTPPQGPLTKPGTPPRTSGGGGNEALNVQRQRYNTAKQLADTVPGASKWIKFTSPTTFKIEQPGMWTSEADKKLYQDITSKIYGNTAGQYTGSGTPGGGRGGGPGRGNQQEKTPVKKEYSPSRNQTRITFSDGTTQIVNGRQ